jgi:hypothetical protein
MLSLITLKGYSRHKHSLGVLSLLEDSHNYRNVYAQH